MLRNIPNSPILVPVIAAEIAYARFTKNMPLDTKFFFRKTQNNPKIVRELDILGRDPFCDALFGK
jgi:hypothetical protein